MSKPEIPINWEKVDEMLLCGCTGSEVAANFGVHPDTLYIRCNKLFNMTFSAYAAEKRAKGDGQLRQAQMKKALKGDNTMMIWLGKQRLGQRENASETVIPEDVLKAFESLMSQIETAKKERETKAPTYQHTDSPQSHAPVSSTIQEATRQGMTRLSVFQ